jgi:peptidyl-tRNA hydrolase, PTH1 family
MAKYLIAGLGNIGSDYAGTRHNIGFDVLDALVVSLNGRFNAERLAEKVELKWHGQILVCIKPSTYMNESGRAVKYWMGREKITTDNILVVLDDLNLPLTKLRLRPGGSDGGHNGLRSIQESLGTEAWPRLRMGVGNNFSKGKQVNFVLGKWTESELPLVQQKVRKGVEVIESFVTIGIERTMSRYNNLEFEL